jgi:TRAP transporter 4TM/12TM fusion protein
MTAPAAASPDLKKLEEKFDPEIRFRPLLKHAAWLVGGLLLALSIFHYYTAGFGLLREQTHRGIHMAFVLGLIFLVFAWRRRDENRPPRASWLAPGGISWIDWALAAAAVFGALFIPATFTGLDIELFGWQLRIEDLSRRTGAPSTLDIVAGTLLIVVLLEATRRSIGWPLPVIALFFMAFMLWGQYFPGLLQHPGMQWSNLINTLYIESTGIYGTALGVVATYVFHFVLFGVLATRIGLGKLFIDMASALAGRYAGGPAKVSIFGSAMFGTISGSSIANTVTVGSLTIPAMIRLGYPRHFAAAVESTASTGGQITPPIMGAAAFLMIEFLNVSYQTIILAAIVPAFMHFFGVFMQVHFEAKRTGLRGLSPEEMTPVRTVLRANWPTAIPLLVLLVVLFSGTTPYLAAFWGITACVVVGLTGRNPYVAVGFLAAVFGATLLGWLKTEPFKLAMIAASLGVSALGVWRLADGRKRLVEMLDAFIVGAKYAIGVGAAAATVGIVIGAVVSTGVGFKFANIVTGGAAALTAWFDPVLPAGLFQAKSVTLFFTLLMTGLVCILMGCGIPTTANYLIMVTFAAPALALLGVEPLVAHMFVFYYGVLADITPPVALAAYAGASMAGADPFRTGNTAFRLGMGKALVPFVFVFSPAMLIVTPGATVEAFLIATLGCAIGVGLLAAAFSAYLLAPLRGWERWLIGVAALVMLAPSYATIGIGLAIVAPVLASQIATMRTAPRPR